MQNFSYCLLYIRGDALDGDYVLARHGDGPNMLLSIQLTS